MNEEARQLRREDARHAVLSHLHDCGMGIARPAAVITRALRTRGYNFSEEEIASACLFRTNEGHFSEERDSAGATRHYRITSSGMKAYEITLV